MEFKKWPTSFRCEGLLLFFCSLFYLLFWGWGDRGGTTSLICKSEVIGEGSGCRPALSGPFLAHCTVRSTFTVRTGS